MNTDNTLRVIIGDAEVAIPSYYQQVDSMPNDPEGSVPLMIQTDNAACFVVLYPIDESREMPRDKETIVAGIRPFLGDDQGLIEVGAGDDFAFTIVKTLKDPGGVQYTLTFHKFADGNTVCAQGYFDEMGVTGMRDNMVYAMLSDEGVVGTEEDPADGWKLDPYDPDYKQGALMNLSEQDIYDEMFPDSPLSMCRELVGFLKQQ